MSLASILLLLQLAVGLLANPNLAGNPTLQAQVNLIANQAISLATQALSQPATTQLGTIPTSSAAFSNVVSSTPNIVLNIVPPVQQSQPIQGTGAGINNPPAPTSTPFPLPSSTISFIPDGDNSPNNIVLGSNGNKLTDFNYNFNDTAQMKGGAYIDSLTIHDSVNPSNSLPINNLSIFNNQIGPNALSVSNNPTPNGDGYDYNFIFSSGLVVNNRMKIYIMGDISSDPSQVGTTHIFSIKSAHTSWPINIVIGDTIGEPQTIVGN